MNIFLLFIVRKKAKGYYLSLANFRNALQTWRRELDQKVNQVRASIAKINTSIDLKKGDILTAQQKLKELRIEKRVLDACNKLLEGGAPKFAFRPLVYEVFDFEKTYGFKPADRYLM